MIQVSYDGLYPDQKILSLNSKKHKLELDLKHSLKGQVLQSRAKRPSSGDNSININSIKINTVLIEDHVASLLPNEPRNSSD